MMGLHLAVATILLTASAFAKDYLPLQSEIMELEITMQRRTPVPAERSRLAQLYFLSSDCGKVKGTLALDVQTSLSNEEKDLSCACDGKCDLSAALDHKGRKQESLYALRQLLQGGATLKDAHVKRLWQAFEQEPEARAMIFQFLKKSKSQNDQLIAQEYLRSLRSLDVGP